DLRDFRPCGRCPALRTQSEEPRFASDLSRQRRQSVIANGIRVPAIRWCSRFRFIQRRKTLDAPKQFSFGKLLDLRFRHWLDNVLRLRGHTRRRREKCYPREERKSQRND